MNTGEKIKYLRKQLGITQDTLAAHTGIHPVSIRKYETNKMQPQPAQLERIAAALGVSYNALNGVNHAGMRLETVGDLMGVLMALIHSGILKISGERGADHMLKKETVCICFNPVLSPFFAIVGRAGELNEQDLLLHVKSQRVLEDLLIWEKMDFLYTSAAQSAEENRSIVQEIENEKEMVELELQKSQVLLDATQGIGVRIPPNYEDQSK